jgi:hypothetical protein
MLAAIIVRRPPEPPRSLAEMRTRFEREFEPQLMQCGTPREVIDICRKATEFEPKRRYATAREMARDIREVLRGMADAGSQLASLRSGSSPEQVARASA